MLERATPVDSERRMVERIEPQSNLICSSDPDPDAFDEASTRSLTVSLTSSESFYHVGIYMSVGLYIERPYDANTSDRDLSGVAGEKTE